MRLNLKAAIKRHGVTQSSVAKAIGITHGYMSLLCSGTKSPSNDIMMRIAAHLEVTPNDLYDFDSETAPPAGPTWSLPPEIRKLPLSAHHVAAATTLYPKLRAAAGYQCRMDLPRFHISEEDLLIVDEDADLCLGDLAVIPGTSPRLTKNIDAASPRLIDHDWNEVLVADTDTKCHPVVALLRSRRT